MSLARRGSTANDTTGSDSPLEGMSVTALRSYAVKGSWKHKPQLSVLIGPSTDLRLLELGFAIGTTTAPIPNLARDRLVALRPSHVRANLSLDDTGWRTDLQAAQVLADQLDSPLEIAIIWQHDFVKDHARLLVEAMQQGVPLSRVLILGSTAALAPMADQRLLEHALRSRLPGVDVLIGALADFAVLNRSWENLDTADGVSFAVSPQVHATDDQSVLENLDAQTDVIRTALGRTDGRKVVVSPVTLGAQGASARHDPRHNSLFGACWTLASVARLAWSGATSATYFELLGSRGLMDRETSDRGGVPSVQDLVFPIYHVFADLADVRSGRLLPTRTMSDLPCAAFGVRTSGGQSLLVANLSDQVVQLRVSGLGRAAMALRLLDEVTAGTACRDPETFRAHAANVTPVDGQIVADLGPFAVARLATLPHPTE